MTFTNIKFVLMVISLTTITEVLMMTWIYTQYKFSVCSNILSIHDSYYVDRVDVMTVPHAGSEKPDTERD